jgi:archaeal flagellin FlaB
MEGVMMSKGKRAEMGVGTLIIFIAMLLVAAVAAGVLIQTAGVLQEKSLTTGQQAKAQISTNARVIEVSASNGQGGNLTEFQEIIKLSPGSDPIKLEQIIFTFNTKDRTSTLKYKGTSGICDKNNVNGYNTWNEEVADSSIAKTVNDYVLAEDLDDDSADDYVYINATGDGLIVNMSTAGPVTIDLNGDVDLSQATTVSNAAIAVGATTYGYLSVAGTTGTPSELDTATTVTIIPYRDGEGYFSAIYEQESTNFVPGNLQRGDIVRFCFEAPGQILEDEEVRLNFIPKIGTATLTQFVTPDVISTERVYLYP